MEKTHSLRKTFCQNARVESVPVPAQIFLTIFTLICLTTTQDTYLPFALTFLSLYASLQGGFILGWVNSGSILDPSLAAAMNYRLPVPAEVRFCTWSWTTNTSSSTSTSTSNESSRSTSTSRGRSRTSCTSKRSSRITAPAPVGAITPPSTLPPVPFVATQPTS